MGVRKVSNSNINLSRSLKVIGVGALWAVT